MPLDFPGDNVMRKYPAFPHSPLLIAAETCNAIILRWRGFETVLWPVERFVLERYPDKNDQPQWTTLLDGNLSNLIDMDILPGRKYAYRVQAISKGNVSSSFDYQWVQASDMNSRVCQSTPSLLNSVGEVNGDGIRLLGLLFACFLTVYGLIRASVMSVQRTQSRKFRLKRIKKSTLERVTSMSSVPIGQPVSMMPRRSSTFTSTSSRSIEGDVTQRGSIFDATSTTTITTAEGLACAPSNVNRSPTPDSGPFQSVRVSKERVSHCKSCGKRFGLFRKRHLCDICHSTLVCRKCGYQASVDSYANARTGVQTNGNDSRNLGPRRLSSSQQQQKKLKIRTICKSCFDDWYAPPARS
ncbi:putative FYVE zinc finger, fibronectin type III, Zinc finger, FYVE/PHD-type [Plasmopara halstedii]